MKKTTIYITVNRGIIDSNRKHGTNRPAIRVATGKYGKPRYGHMVTIEGDSIFVYRPTDPLPHGARLWVETRAPIRMK